MTADRHLFTLEELVVIDRLALQQAPKTELLAAATGDRRDIEYAQHLRRISSKAIEAITELSHQQPGCDFPSLIKVTKGPHETAT